MGYNTSPLVFGAVRPSWTDDGRCWYRVIRADGTEFVLVDPASGVKRPAFDHARVAAALSRAAHTAYDAKKLPFTDIDLAGSDVLFNLSGKRWKCDSAGSACVVTGNATGGGRGRGGRGGGFGAGGRAESMSPDKKRAVFIRDNNLWVARRRHRQGNPAHHRRREGFRLRDGQRRMGLERPADCGLVARLEKDRDLSAGPARRGRNVPGEHAGGPSAAESMEISAAGR